ncbi:MAG: hypothetical protein M3Q48_03250 [Actinomycetota bacterium]|nr:hypothetical protein [Actinomycetota bacterium]
MSMRWDTDKREGGTGAGAAMLGHEPWPMPASQFRGVVGYALLACTNDSIVRPTGLLGAPAG